MAGNLKRQVDMDGGKGASQSAPAPAPEPPNVHEKVEPKPAAPAKPVETPKAAAPAPKTVAPAPKPAAPAPATKAPGEKPLTAGHVAMYSPDRNFGFVDAGGQSFYLPGRLVPKDAQGRPISINDKDVEFTFEPSREPGKKPTITSIRLKQK